MEVVNILGKVIQLKKKVTQDLKGLSTGTKLSFNFYDGIAFGESLLFLKPKGDNPTPRICTIIGAEVYKLMSVPAVFMLKPSTSSERMRLMDKGVYFVMSDKYAHLPTIVAAERVSDRKPFVRLSPVAQFLLLYHLQIRSIEGKSPKEVAEIVPYSYEGVTLALTCLSDLGLCEKVIVGRNRKFHFIKKGEELWADAEIFAINPIARKFYCDSIQTDLEGLSICGVNALSHYSTLNPDPENMIMITEHHYRELSKQGIFVNANGFDGEVIVEVWKYPALDKSGFVDKLSLYLTLKDDSDERVQGEIELVKDNILWRD